MSVCGTGGWTGPVPGDPSNVYGLAAIAVFGGIYVSWSYPLTHPEAVAHTRVYRSTSDVFATAQVIAKINGDFYFDTSAVSISTTYYYWIEPISIHGTVGGLVGPVNATALPLINDLLVALTDKIDSGLLANALKTKILTIDQLGLDLTQEAVFRVEADNALTVLVSDMQTENTTTRAMIIAEQVARATENDAFVSSLNAAYVAIGNTEALILTETTARVAGDSALASQITNVQTQMGTDLAGVQTTLQTNINTVDGKVTGIGARWTATVTVNNLVGGFGIYNDGSTIQAGFDVDEFWVGKTQANKVKPFIISGGTVYMQNVVVQNALIESLTASKLTAGDITAVLGITTGSLNLTGSGKIYGGKSTYAAAANGFFLGFDAGIPKFRIGNAADTVSMTWDGTDLIIKGGLMVTGFLFPVGQFLRSSIGGFNDPITSFLQLNTDRSHNAQNTIDPWAIGIADPGDYDVRFIRSTGTLAGGGDADNTWLRMNVARKWGVFASGGTTATVTGTIQLRRRSDNKVVTGLIPTTITAISPTL